MPGSRLRSVLLACATLAAGFAVVIVGLRITDAMAIIAYAGGLVLFGAASWFVGRRQQAFTDALAQERQLLAIGTVCCAAVYPFLANDAYQLHVMAMAGIFALMGLGLNVTVGFAGLAEFGYIAYYAIGAYTSALINVRFGVNFWLCMPVAAFAAASLGTLVALPALRVKGHYLGLVTLGFGFIVIQLITNLEKVTGGTQGVFGIQPPALFGHSFQKSIRIGEVVLPYQANFYYLVLAMLILAAWVCVNLQRSRWGRVWAAMQADEVATSAVGLNLTKLKFLAFATGASFGGIAGSLYAHMVGYIDPSGFRIIESIFLLAVVAVGNWRVPGVIAAAVIFTIMPEKLRAFADWRLLIFGILLLVVMLARGRSIAGSGR